MNTYAHIHAKNTFKLYHTPAYTQKTYLSYFNFYHFIITFYLSRRNNDSNYQ